MAQETDLWEQETSSQTSSTEERKKHESATGRDLPSGDGDVGDEQVNAIDRDDLERATGLDHSTDVTENREPDEGVGAIQESSDTRSDTARISD